jgi:hypothetical protein
VLAYASIWALFGYKKVISVPRPWWKRWGQPYSYKNIRIMGGRLRDDAKATIKRERINPQIYFEGTGYDQDSVWTRGSRAIAQITLIFTYFMVVLFYTLTIAVTVT